MRLVIDTNIVLDAFVFADGAAKPLRAKLEAGDAQWLATQAMREELKRVLGYSQIAPRLAFYALQPADVLACFDRHVELHPDAPRAANLRCRDADDQRFIDLAVQHQAVLLSKDRHILSMRKRLAARMVTARAAIY